MKPQKQKKVVVVAESFPLKILKEERRFQTIPPERKHNRAGAASWTIENKLNLPVLNKTEHSEHKNTRLILQFIVKSYAQRQEKQVFEVHRRSADQGFTDPLTGERRS